MEIKESGKTFSSEKRGKIMLSWKIYSALLLLLSCLDFLFSHIDFSSDLISFSVWRCHLKMKITFFIFTKSIIHFHVQNFSIWFHYSIFSASHTKFLPNFIFYFLYRVDNTTPQWTWNMHSLCFLSIDLTMKEEKIPIFSLHKFSLEFSSSIFLDFERFSSFPQRLTYNFKLLITILSFFTHSMELLF